MNKRKTTKTNLENKRIIFLEIGFIVALAIIFAAFEYKSYDQIIKIDQYFRNHEPDEELAPIILKKKEVIPKKPQSFMVLNEVPDDSNIDTEIEIDASDDPDIAMQDWDPIEEEETPVDEVVPSYAVSIPPEFPGGEAAMLKFLADNFKIPRIDRENGISGTIGVKFVINKEGKVVNARIIRSLSESSDLEALRVVNMMPRWKPGQQSIKKVSVEYILPIKVRLI